MTSPNNIFLAPCSREQKSGTYRHFRDTVLDGIAPSEYSDVPDYATDSIAVWGVVSGNQSAWEVMQPGDKVLFYTRQRMYTHEATVVSKQENKELAGEIWTPYDEGRRVADVEEGWPYIFYLENIRQVDIYSEDFHNDIGWKQYYPQSFTRIIEERQEMLEEKYGSLSAAIREHAEKSLGNAPVEIEETTEKLLEEQSVEQPTLTDSETSFTTTERRERSTAFRRSVIEAYDRTCAICKSTRASPGGNPEVEAAHIYPKRENGSDDVRNGLSLCRLHHWAFDVGWISLSDEYEILVRNEQGRETYEELEQYDGQQIRLPDREKQHPHPMFLAEHRALHGFSD